MDPPPGTEREPDPIGRPLSACLEVGKLLTSTLDLEEILHRIMTRLRDLIEAENWSLALRDETTGDLTFEIVVGEAEASLAGARMARGEGVVGHVAETGEAVCVPDVNRDGRFSPRMDAVSGFQTRSLLCVPLKFGGTVLGVIEIVNVKDIQRFETRTLPILTVLADYAAIAIQNARLVARIQRMTVIDEYTGLYNARYLHQVLEELVLEADASGTELAVVFVDVDDFKQIVDRYGHLLGSRVLKEIGRTIASHLGRRDILVKYGGDEYVILLPGRGREDARALTEQIRSAIRKTVYLQGEPRPVRCTASFGLSVYPRDSKSKRELLLRADNAMFEVKGATKDAVGVA